MSANLLTLNSSKTEFLIIGLKQQLYKIDNCSLNTTHPVRKIIYRDLQHNCQTTSRTAAVWNQSLPPTDSLQAAAARGTVLTSYGLEMKIVYRRTTIQLLERLGYAPVDNKKRHIDPSRLLRMSVMVSVAVSQVGMTELIFVNPGVKVKGQYYCNILLSQQMLPTIKRVAKRCLFTKQYVA